MDLMKRKVWPENVTFQTIPIQQYREWWAGLFKELISDIGVKGVE
jgi:alpha-glucosidase